MPFFRGKEQQVWREDPIEAFVHEVQKRKLPIVEEDAATFAQAVQNLRPPGYFLQRLLKDIQYIDEHTFHRDMDHYAKRIKKNIGKMPYAVAFSAVEGSGPWIYEQLVERGLPETKLQFAAKDTYHIGGMYNIADLHRVVPRDIPILLPEDMAITCVQLEDLLLEYPSMQYQTLVSPMYGNKSNLNLIQRRYPNSIVTAQKEIKKGYQAMKDMDREFLLYFATVQEISPEGLDQLDPGREDIIFLTYYKLPDTTLKVLTEEAHYPLFREASFEKPYPTT